MYRTFRIVPGSMLARVLLVTIGTIAFISATQHILTGMPGFLERTLCLALAVLMFYIAWSTQHVEAKLSSWDLRIVNDLFGRRVLRTNLLPYEARIISLKTEKSYRPFIRTFGTGAPGYLAGWFRLRNWKKAYGIITSWDRVVLLPTTLGYCILLSIAEPEAFIAELRS